jgi:hypothetical protein
MQIQKTTQERATSLQRQNPTIGLNEFKVLCDKLRISPPLAGVDHNAQPLLLDILPASTADHRGKAHLIPSTKAWVLNPKAWLRKKRDNNSRSWGVLLDGTFHNVIQPDGTINLKGLQALVKDTSLSPTFLEGWVKAAKSRANPQIVLVVAFGNVNLSEPEMVVSSPEILKQILANMSAGMKQAYWQQTVEIRFGTDKLYRLNTERGSNPRIQSLEQKRFLTVVSAPDADLNSHLIHYEKNRGLLRKVST